MSKPTIGTTTTEKKSSFSEYIKEQQKSWTKLEWLHWYWYGFIVTLEHRLYPLTKLRCKYFGHSKQFTDECARCGVDL